MTTDANTVRNAFAKHSKSPTAESDTTQTVAKPVATDVQANAVESGRYETIKVDRRERVGLITLYRPKQLNAISTKLSQEVLAALGEFDQDDQIGAIVITGNA